MVATNPLLSDALRRKEDYRRSAKELSWEEKIMTIERMREASIEAKRCMKESLSDHTTDHTGR